MIFHECLVAILFNIVVATESIFTDVVETGSGPVRGEILRTARRALEYASFKGIPYAEAPVGKRRFQAAVEKAKWNDVLVAAAEGNVCPQYYKWNSSIVGSEDCLFINVYTPHVRFDNCTKSRLQAVLVWIHGGGFVSGSSNAGVYGPDFLLEQNVIVVSFNYRLGPLGFLNVNHAGANGNVGLKDQNLALKWVKKNIINFGGDPCRITIFGQSAGAVSVDLHVLSDMSTGLFRQSISISGSPLCLYWGMQSQNEATSRAFALGRNLGIKAKNKDELLKALYEIPAAKIILEARKLRLLPFRPTVEKSTKGLEQERFLSKCAVDKYISGEYNKGPHMMGFTSEEAKSFVEPEFMQTKYLKNLLYKATKLLTNPLMQFMSNAFFVTGIDAKQRLLSRNNRYPIYYYRFSFENKTSCTSSYCDRGVGHADDLPYLFYSPQDKMYTNGKDEQIIIERYSRLFANFAKYGNPTPHGMNDSWLQITWPNSGPSGLHLEIDRNLTIGPRPISQLVELYESAGLGNSRVLNACEAAN